MATTLIQKAGHSDLFDLRIKKHWLDGYTEEPHEFEQIYRMDSITTEDTRTSFHSGFGRWAESGESQPFQYDTILQGLDTTCTPYQYKLGYTISEIAVEDDPTGILAGKLAAAHANSCRETQEYLAALPFNNATTAGGSFSPWQSGGDGLAMLSLLHPLAAGGVFVNTPSTQVDLDQAPLEASVIRMRKSTNQRGFPWEQTPTTLVVPLDYMFMANQLINTSTTPALGDSNTPNVLNKMFTKVIQWTRLTDPDSWFILADKAKEFGMKGHTLTWVWRIKPSFDRDNVFETGDRRYSGRFRAGIYQPTPYGVDGSVGI